MAAQSLLLCSARRAPSRAVLCLLLFIMKVNHEEEVCVREGRKRTYQGRFEQKGQTRDQFDQQCEANDATLNVRKSG